MYLTLLLHPLPTRPSDSKDLVLRTKCNHQYFTKWILYSIYSYIPTNFQEKVPYLHCNFMHPNRYCLNTVQEKLRFPFKSFSFPIWVSQHNVLHILSTTHKCFLLPQIMSPLFSPSILHYIENSILRLTDSHDFHSGLVTQQWTTLLPRSSHCILHE